jgi:hypothetical protein
VIKAVYKKFKNPTFVLGGTMEEIQKKKRKVTVVTALPLFSP